jgi:hypothetical protein
MSRYPNNTPSEISQNLAMKSMSLPRIVSLFLMHSPVGEKLQHLGHIVYKGVDFYGPGLLGLLRSLYE